MTARIILIVVLLAFVARSAERAYAQAAKDDDAKTNETTPPAPKVEGLIKKPKAALLPWTEGLDAGLRSASRAGQPVFVRVGGEFCPWCKKLDLEIEKPAVQRELARWALVTIDADKSADDARRLGVGGIPALRVLTPRGTTVSTRDGFLPADELVAWLSAQFDKAAAAPDELLTDESEPSTLDVIRLIRVFKQPNAIEREAVVRRLFPYPQAAATAVVQAFGEGNLATRLTALELLREWKAPLEDLDPWQPATITKDRLAKLDEWAVMAAAQKPAEPTPLSETDLEAARADIARLLKAQASDADAIRERLARFGIRLLPEVQEHCSRAETDQARERLTALRYRLAGTDSLALNWPGGFVRLASRDPTERHAAADELIKRSTSREEPLLLELFSDADPLMREISLRGLRSVAGEKAGSALVKLLDDPEPNVRAAVLKQLAEAPPAGLAPRIAEYVLKEKDPDLVVHGVRVLREAKSKAGVASLMKLLKHESWQVRAEAAESVVKLMGNDRSSYGQTANDQKTVEVYTGLVDLLEDSDTFVVSRALESLGELRMDIVESVELLAKVVTTHPALATKAIEVMVNGDQMKIKAVPHLRKYSTHQDAAVRAAAIHGLCIAVPGDLAKEITAGVNDDTQVVRIAAAQGLFQLLNTERNVKENELNNQANGRTASTLRSPSLMARALKFFNSGSEEKSEKKDDAAEKPAEVDPSSPDWQSPYDQWLLQYRAGKKRPAWMADLVEPLKKMLAVADAPEQLSAAMPLVALGKQEQALAILLALAKDQPAMQEQIDVILPWLVWSERLAFFQQLVALSATPDTLNSFVNNFTEVIDARLADPLWKLLADPNASGDLASTVKGGLAKAYLGERYYDRSNVSESARKQVLREAAARIDKQRRWQTVTALALINSLDGEQGTEAALPLVKDSKLDPDLRADAFQILLTAQPAADSRKQSLAALSDANPKIRKLALIYLCDGFNRLSQLLDTHFYLETNAFSSRHNRTRGTPILVAPPDGLQPERLLPLVKDSDPDVSSYARYLLVLLDQPEHLDPLIDDWQARHRTEDEWTQFVYRAIAYSDESSKLPILKEIYAKLDEYEVSDFYWTIRNMKGQELLRFRKQIRDEVGVDKLR